MDLIKLKIDTMKKVLVSLLGIMMTMTVFSQLSFEQSNLRFSGGLMYGSDISSAGLNLQGTYALDETWEAGVGFTSFFGDQYVKWSVLDLDAHYVFSRPNDKIDIYGVGAISALIWKIEIPAIAFGGFSSGSSSTTGTDLGVSVGVGANYKINESFYLAPEFRYTIVNGSFLRFGITFGYKLG